MLYPDKKKKMKTVLAVALSLVALVAVSGMNILLFAFTQMNGSKFGQKYMYGINFTLDYNMTT